MNKNLELKFKIGELEDELTQANAYYVHQRESAKRWRNFSFVMIIVIGLLLFF